MSTLPLICLLGLMISGFAQCGAILGKKEYIDRAVRAASFLQNHMFNASSGKLLRTCYQGQGNTVTHRYVTGNPRHYNASKQKKTWTEGEWEFPQEWTTCFK